MIGQTRRLRRRPQYSQYIADISLFVAENREAIEQKTLHFMAVSSIGMGAIILAQGIPTTCKILFSDVLPIFFEFWGKVNV